MSLQPSINHIPMATEQSFPRGRRASSDLGRFTRVAPSTAADSEHEVLVEMDSDSDILSLKGRENRDHSSDSERGRKKITHRKKQSPTTNGLQPDPVISEDLLYHLMDQNKILMDQNKALTKRVDLLDPFPIACPRAEPPLVHEYPPLPHDMPYPPQDPYLPDFAQPTKRKPKESKDDKLYAQCKELWEVLPRLVRVLEAAATTPNADVAIVKPVAWNAVDHGGPFAEVPIWIPSPLDSAPVPSEEIMLSMSKNVFMSVLADAERKYGINQKSKKNGKKLKSKVDAGKFMGFSKAELMPWVWKALGFMQTFLLVFLMIQLSLVGRDALGVSQKSSKSGAWLGFW